MKKEKKRGRRILRRLLSVLLILVVLLAAVMYLVPLFEHVNNDPVEGSADWMAKLDGKLPLNEINLPGTHDSATQYVGLPFFSRCQDLSVRGQLNAGFRYLDIRLGDSDGRLKLMHGFVNCKTGAAPWSGALYLDAVLKDCYAFLKEHPTETVVFAVKQEHGDLSASDFENLLAGYIAKNPDQWLLTDRIPTLEQARGRLVLMRRYEDEAGLGANSGIPMLWKDQNGHDDVSLHAAEEDNGYLLRVQDRYCYGAGDKWNAFLAGLDTASTENGTISLHFLSTKGTLPFGHAYYFAGKLNPKLMKTELPGRCGWIVVDFGTAKLAQMIYSTNFAN